MKKSQLIHDSASSHLALCIVALLFNFVTFLTLPTSTQAAPTYRIQVALPPTLTVGEELQQWDAQIRILRPSPGDNFWYRLPHTVQITGNLPPGLRLAQIFSKRRTLSLLQMPHQKLLLRRKKRLLINQQNPLPRL